MKKVLLASLVLLTSAMLLPNSALAAPSGSWSCANGVPQNQLEWDEHAGASSYQVRLSGSTVATVNSPETFYTHSNRDYNSSYHYTIVPNNGPATQTIDINTGSCVYVSSVTGPTELTAGQGGTYTANFVAGHKGNLSTVVEVRKDGNVTWIGGGSYPTVVANASGSVFPTAGTYQVCGVGTISETGSIPGSVLTNTNCMNVTVTGGVDLWVNGGESATLTKGQNANMTWDCIGASSCESTVTTGQALIGWSGITQASKNDVGLSVGPFNDTITNAGVYVLKIAFNPEDTVEVTVNEPQTALLNVNSSGASGVVISGTGGVSGGTTNYTSSDTSTISGTLVAPATAGSQEFSSWSGCDSVSGANCTVSVAPSETQTVTANYVTPTPDPQPNLVISGSIGVSPSSPTVGDNVDFTATVQNSGDAEAAKSKTQLKIDLYSNGGGSLWDITSNKNTKKLSAGATDSESWDNAWTAVEGTHLIRVCADNDSEVTESNESDNCTDRTVTVSAPQAVLNVHSSGVSGMTVVSPNGYGGVTNYTKTSSSNINEANLVATFNFGGKEFSDWTGCDTIPQHTENVCLVSVSTGSSKTVTANYTSVAPFSYTLSNSGTLTIDKSSGVGQEVITRTLTSGSSEAVSLAVSGLPLGVSVSGISNNPCSPTCSSTITFSVAPTTLNGDYQVTVTGSPNSVSTTFTLRITGSLVNVTCTPSPAVAAIGQPVTWTANVSGGIAPYTYVWSGTGVPTNPAPTANPYTLTYSTIGQKTITVEVTDATTLTASCPSDSSVQINFDPQFEEF